MSNVTILLNLESVLLTRVVSLTWRPKLMMEHRPTRREFLTYRDTYTILIANEYNRKQDANRKTSWNKIKHNLLNTDSHNRRYDQEFN